MSPILSLAIFFTDTPHWKGFLPCSKFWRPSPHARIEKSPCKRSCKRFERVYCVIFFARRGFRCRRGRCGCVANSIMEKSRHPRDVRGCGRFISTALPGSPNGGASRPDCNLTLKAAPGHMLRACPTRAANKARPCRAVAAAFHTALFGSNGPRSFPNCKPG